MNIQTAEFICSNSDFTKCPSPDKPEFAFIGRSNVGKSSLINMLTSRKGLAKTSGTPGKTQLINHFLVNSEWYLVDLPGYGFAKISRSISDKWDEMIGNYLTKRTNLLTTFILIDSRLQPQKSDIDFIEKMGVNELPFSLIFTKTDKLTKNELKRNIELYKKSLLESWEELPPVFLSSADTGLGREEILNYIGSLM